jgi:putative MATE family efflux protein
VPFRADDRQIVKLAVPALGALAAGPLYVLVDTAIVGHLGVAPLAALALAGALIDAISTFCNFLQYGVTPRVGRLFATGKHDQAAHVGHQGMLLGFMLGIVIAALMVLLAQPLLAVLGARGRVMSLATLYIRLAIIGLPLSLVAVSAEGYFRGVAKLKAPMWVLLACNALNALLEVLFVYGFHWGIAGSAWGTVIAQATMALSFCWMAGLRPNTGTGVLAGLRPDWPLIREMLRVGADLVIRTAALYASFLISGAILARVGQASLAAHQIAFQLWNFLALALDSLAIAAQVMVSHQLALGDKQRARRLGARVILWSFVVGTLFGVLLLALTPVLPHAFTADARVLNRVDAIWVIFAAMQPVNGVVFALDGILIGASDTRYLALAMVPCTVLAYVPVACAAVIWHWGIVGVWCAIFAFILARMAFGAGRFLGSRWTLH